MPPPASSDVGLAPTLMGDKEATSLRLKLRRIARTPIRAVPPDMPVKIRGRVTLRGPALTAPITGAPCALYCLDVVDTNESLHLDGEDDLPLDDPRIGNGWRLPREIRGRDLILDDGTAHALVRVDGAQLSLLGNWTTSLATTQAQFLISHGRPPPRTPRDPAMTRYLEYRELKIVPGELVTVWGHASYEADPAPHPAEPHAYRVSRHRCAFAATPAAPLYIVQERVAALDAVG